MAVSPDTKNYLYGKGELFFKREGESGFIHLGNAPAFSITVSLENAEHYSSMSGTKEKDLSEVIQKGATSSITLEEFSASNLNIAFLGDGVVSTTQTAGSEEVSVSIIPDEFVELGRMGVYTTKVYFSNLTGGSFEKGDTVTGATSSATGSVAYVGESYVRLIDVNGSFESGEQISADSASAVVTAVSVEDDVIVCDSDGSTCYTQGEDYIISATSGMIMALSSGSISGDTLKISYDYPEKVVQSINALANSSCKGHLRFVGNPDIGPKMIVDIWKASLTVSGEVAFIGEDVSSFPIEGEFLSDSMNHPSCPFFKVTRFD